MKHYLTVIIFCSLFTACQTEVLKKSEKIHSLKKNIIDISEPSQPLNFLDEELKGVDIVALGEQSHGDGATFEEKIRWIQYLHEELGFNVLVFEAGLMDCYYGNLEMEQGVPAEKAIHNSVFEVWSEASQLETLYNYMDSQRTKGTPLILGGFDIQFTGVRSFEDRIKSFEQIISKQPRVYSRSDYNGFFNILLKKESNNNRKKYSDEEKEAFYHDIKSLVQLIDAVKHPAPETKIWKRTLENTEKLFRFYWEFRDKTGKTNPEVANTRDLEMGENMIWLKETLYPNEKLILWGANSHLFYNRQMLTYPDNMIPMGQTVKTQFKNRYYAIGFTSYTGSIGSRHYPPRNMGQVSNKTIESLLHELNIEKGYLSFRNLETNNWLKHPFKGRFLGHMDYSGKWIEMMDSMVFIHTQIARITMKKFNKKD